MFKCNIHFTAFFAICGTFSLKTEKHDIHVTSPLYIQTSYDHWNGTLKVLGSNANYENI